MNIAVLSVLIVFFLPDGAVGGKQHCKTNNETCVVSDDCCSPCRCMIDFARDDLQTCMPRDSEKDVICLEQADQNRRLIKIGSKSGKNKAGKSPTSDQRVGQPWLGISPRRVSVGVDQGGNWAKVGSEPSPSGVGPSAESGWHSDRSGPIQATVGAYQSRDLVGVGRASDKHGWKNSLKKLMTCASCSSLKVND